MSARVSVVVPAWQARETAERFGALMAAQTLPRDAFEVILVDDGSTDGTAEAARRAGIDHVISLPERSGPYVARNTGVAAASAPILAFTDVDCEPAADWLERGLGRLADPAVDVLGGAIEVPLGDRPSRTTLLDVCNFVDQERAVSRGYSLGGNTWVRREVFDRVGGFNENLQSGGDQEFTRRAVAAGAALAYAADAVVVHEPYRRARGLARKARRIGFGAAQHHRYAGGSMAGRPLICNRPGYYLPYRKLHGADRLERLGYPLGRRERLTLLAAAYVLVQMPMVLGNLEGAITAGRRPRR